MVVSEIAAYVLVALGFLLKLLFGRSVKAGVKRQPDAEYYAPIASRWVGPRGIRAGEWASLTCMLAGAASLAYYLSFAL